MLAQPQTAAGLEKRCSVHILEGSFLALVGSLSCTPVKSISHCKHLFEQYHIITSGLGSRGCSYAYIFTHGVGEGGGEGMDRWRRSFYECVPVGVFT